MSPQPAPGATYNFGAFVDKREIKRPQWDPSGVKPALVPEPRK